MPHKTESILDGEDQREREPQKAEKFKNLEDKQLHSW